MKRRKYYQHTTASFASSCFSTKKNEDLKNEEFGVLQKFAKNRKTDWYMPNAKQDKKLQRRFVRDEKRSNKSSDTEPQWQFRNMLESQAAGIVPTKNEDLGTNFHCHNFF